MMDEFFDDFIERSKHERLRDQRRRDEHLQVFRAVWDGLRLADQQEFKSLLHTLYLLHERFGALTRHQLSLPNIAMTDFSDWPEEAMAGTTLGPIMKQLGPVYIVEAEYLCAIACWEAGEEYVPSEPTLDSHPRWPYRSRFDTTDPAPN